VFVAPLLMGTRRQASAQISIPSSMSSWAESNLRRAARLVDIFNFAIPIRLQLFEFCDLQA